MTQPEDIRSLPRNSEVTTDLCIVGSGPAGLAIARSFAGSGVRVLLLESGSLSDDTSVDALSMIENAGAPRVLDQTLVRNRVFGGSTQTWKGRCTSFAPTDFERRDWVPNSGWPLSFSEVQKFVDEAATFLGLGPNVYDARLFAALGLSAPEPELDRSLVETQFWQFCNTFEFPYGQPPYGPVQIGREFLKSPAPGVRILLNATVTHLNTNTEGTRLTSLEVSSLGGDQVTVTAKATVLCAGGIENARLLLASNRTIASGVGNTHDNVGRYLMDHLRLEVGDFALEDANVVQDRFDFYRVKSPAGYRAYLLGMVLSRALQEREKLLHCAGWVEQAPHPDDPWPALRSLLRKRSGRRLRDLSIVVEQSPIVARGLYRSVLQSRGIRHKPGKLALMAMVEQIPDRNSRITLSSRNDALGMPTSRVDWKVNPREVETIVRTAEIMAKAFAQANLPKPRLADWVREHRYQDAPVIDVAHPTGATRMSVEARDGVVDTTCRVHGVEGLYVAGMSVFPTAGHANPTLLLVGLALRLAEHLKTTVFADYRPAAQIPEPAQLFSPPAVPVPGGIPRRVLVTGGTGKIGRPLVTELLRRGYAVRLVTSQKGYVRHGVEVYEMNWFHNLDFAPLVQGCDAVLHLGAELRDPSKMQRVNVEATRALANAAEAAGVRFFGYASTVSVYGSATRRIVTEDSPVVDDPGTKYLTVPFLRAYAASKLAGEREIRAVAKSTTYVVYRPTAVVDVDALESMRDWRRNDRLRDGGCLTNHVYVGDVVEAMIWCMDRGLATPKPGNQEVFNISDESEFATYGDLYREAFRATGDSRFKMPPAAFPAAYHLVRDAVRHRAFAPKLRYPFGMLRFPPRKLLEAGFHHPYGLDAFYRRTLQRLREQR